MIRPDRKIVETNSRVNFKRTLYDIQTYLQTLKPDKTFFALEKS